jgi:spoIIIJ-associated protein
MEDNLQHAIQDIMKLLLSPVVSDYEYSILKEGEQYRINISGSNSAALMAFNAELLHAIQHLLRVLVHQRLPQDRTHFILDVNSSRLNREKFINEQIPEMAKTEVLAQGMTIIIKNLTSYERRLIHTMLEEVIGLETMSVGEGNSRKLLIRPTSDTGSLGIDNSKIVDIDAI